MKDKQLIYRKINFELPATQEFLNENMCQERELTWAEKTMLRQVLRDLQTTAKFLEESI